MQVSSTENLINRTDLVEWVRLFGGAASDAVLDPSISYFIQPGINGFIGYRKGIKCAVVFGDPVCSIQDREKLTVAFHAAVRAQGMQVIYIAASESFGKWALGTVCGSLLEMGHELIYDPFDNPKERSGNHGSLVRRKVKRAIRENVSIHEFQLGDENLQKQIEEVGVKWLKARRGPQIHISNVYLFDDCHGKRWFYAQVGDVIVGSISLNRIEEKGGWLINHLMTLPEAPIGTSEMLFTSVLEVLKAEGCRYVTVGFATSKTLGNVIGFNKFTTIMARYAFSFARKIYGLDNLQTFWGKFHPQTAPSYILLSRKGIGLLELLSISRAMNGPV